MQKIIYWLIQDNQVAPVIIDFFKTLQVRLAEQIDLKFIIPESSPETIEKTEPLKPIVFKVLTRTATDSYPAYQAKREALGDTCYTDGLKIKDTLLLDDFGGGNTRQTQLGIPFSKDVGGLVVQIPTPLGSSELEESIFMSAIRWASTNKIPSLGYEMLPLDTRWTLAASMPDGVIVKTRASLSYLKKQLVHDNIWIIPNYEAAVLSPVSSNFHLNGVRASYHYRNQLQIPWDRTIVYLPHNVAMNHEYKGILKILMPLGKNLHLMFGVGKDQVRGVYSQQDTVKIIYEKELSRFASHSFHDLNKPWEMIMANAVIAGSNCFHALVAQNKVPCVIYDRNLPVFHDDTFIRTNNPEDLLNKISTQIDYHRNTREMADILIMLSKAGV